MEFLFLGRPKNGTIYYSPNLQANELNIEEIIKEKIHKDVYLKNDGMCAGIAEKAYGSLKESSNGIFLGIGTGIGTAVFMHGKLEEDIRSAGHMIIEKNGKRCNCGKNGCYEAYASMKVLKTQLRNRFQNENLSSKEILTLLQNSNEITKVEDILKEYIEYLAIGIANMARICSADTVCIGGSFIYFKDILFERLIKELDRIMVPMEKEMTKIKLATLGNDAGMIGATLIN